MFTLEAPVLREGSTLHSNAERKHIHIDGVIRTLLSFQCSKIASFGFSFSQWAQKPPCGSFLELRRKKESTITSSSASPTPSASASAKPTKYAESIIVRVMDSCAGCKAGIPHVDLTKAAFKQLYALDIGYAL